MKMRVGIRRVQQLLLIVGLLAIMRLPLLAQNACIRIMDQDTTLDNLIDPPGLETTPFGSVGRVDKVGTGTRTMVLIPGAGFGGEVFREFMEANKDTYTMYAITLAGFGGTPPPPCPPTTVSYGEQTWTNAAVEAVGKLMESDGIQRAVVLGHWLTGTQVAVRLAEKYPNRVSGVVLVSGAATMYPTDTVKYPPSKITLKVKVDGTDKYMAPQWFKTVTRETWDDNNFLPGDYAVNPIRALRLWRWAATPMLHTWIRYLCEFNSQDINPALDSLTLPVLVMKPGLEGNYSDPGNDYMRAFCELSWKPSVLEKSNVRTVTINDSRAFIWFDQPKRFNEELEAFSAGLSM